LNYIRRSIEMEIVACRYATNAEIINLEMKLSRYYNFISYNINKLLVNYSHERRKRYKIFN